VGSDGDPVILSGDFNADPLHRNGVRTYDTIVAAGFDDAWADEGRSCRMRTPSRAPSM